MSELNKLRWRCRRGSLELDLMLHKYFDSCYPAASPKEQQAFLSLLELDDSELMRHLLGECVLGDEGIDSFYANFRKNFIS